MSPLMASIRIKHQVRKLIQSLAHDKIVIISTHILEEVSAVCTRAVVIAHGKLLADGTHWSWKAARAITRPSPWWPAEPLDQAALAALPGVAGVEEKYPGTQPEHPRQAG